MEKHEKINYIEFPSKDINKTKKFFDEVFGWEFTDYGPDYVDVSNAGIAAGFFRSDRSVSQADGSVLVVFYSNVLEDTQKKIEQAGGVITKPIFAFPGGRRFHFTDLNGSEYAVWSDMGLSGEESE